MSRYLILVADDSPEVHSVTGAYFKVSGFDVLHANNGVEAMNTMKRVTPDLVLLDIQMPEMDGFDTLECIKSTRHLVDVPVLFLSSLDRPNLKVKGLQMGADDYIVKPFNQAELIARVSACLRRSEKFRRLENTFGGHLSQVTIAEVLQTMDLGKKAGRIVFPDINATIDFENRHILRSRCGPFEGSAALHRILFLERGRFEVDFEAAFEVENEPLDTIQSVILSAMVSFDEINSILGEHLMKDVLLEPGARGLPAELQDLESGIWPATVADVITQMSGDLKDNATVLTDAESEGFVVIVDQ